MTREEAHDILDDNWTKLVNPRCTEEELADAQNLAIEALKEERKHGRWTVIDLDNYKKYKVVCPFCGMEYIDNYDGYITVIDFNFCPNCGAAMDAEE